MKCGDHIAQQLALPKHRTGGGCFRLVPPDILINDLTTSLAPPREIELKQHSFDFLGGKHLGKKQIKKNGQKYEQRPM